MSNKTWPEYPPQGGATPKLNARWLILVLLFAAAGAIIYYQQHPQTNVPSAQRAAQVETQQQAISETPADQSGDKLRGRDALDSIADDLFPTGDEPMRRELPWEECRTFIEQTNLPIAATRTVVIDNDAVRAIRYDFGDGGNLLMTCRHSDNSLTITPSSPSAPGAKAPAASSP